MHLLKSTVPGHIILLCRGRDRLYSRSKCPYPALFLRLYRLATHARAEVDLKENIVLLAYLLRNVTATDQYF